ncbi:MAG: hypothetical protein RJB39_651 [Candidatus Parcubacteria bacterium]|jgi:ubiquinone/menaquinone biosynthesis C-methylase UbiE
MVYQAWKEFKGGTVVATSKFSEKFFEFVPAGSIVLDLGCGDGRISKLLQDHGYKTYGMDVNVEAITFAQNSPELKGIEFSVQDAKSTNYNDGFYDGVIEQAVLACMEKSDRSAVLKEVHRILKPHGIFSVTEFGIRPDREERYKADALITGENGTMIIKHADGTEWFRSHNFNKDELDALILGAGFEIISYESPIFKTLHGNPHPGHQYILKRV